MSASRAVALSWLALSMGCASSSITGPRLGQPVTLRVGEEVLFPSESLHLGFAEVQGDSRCPPGVVCVWAGVATVVVWAEKPPHPRSDVVLSTSTWGDTGPRGRYLDYTLELVSLSAAPAHDVPPDYRLTLALTSD